MQHTCVRLVDRDVHISWSSLLPNVSAELYGERRNNKMHLSTFAFGVWWFRSIWWLCSLIFSLICISSCLHVTKMLIPVNKTKQTAQTGQQQQNVKCGDFYGLQMYRSHFTAGCTLRRLVGDCEFRYSLCVIRSDSQVDWSGTGCWSCDGL